MLEMLNETILLNGMSYMLSILAEKSDKDLLSYLKSKVLFADESIFTFNENAKIFNVMRTLDSIPFSEKRASLAIVFSDAIKTNCITRTFFTEISGDILIGKYLEGSLSEQKKEVYLERNVFNLGTLITGVPGTGKTSSAMSIIKQILFEKRPYSAIISPTEEWNSFGSELDMSILRLYDSNQKLSFFNCDKRINIEYFYENLAMLISSASNSGPYKNSMEKCLLSAFNKLYKISRTPEPEDVYEAIFEKIVERHGKRSNIGIKFTKHGENILAALEPMRLMLQKKQFAYSDGLEIEKLLKKGVIFDLSKVSNAMKPFYYSLILNQIYMLTGLFDTNGDRELRMLLCIEEAQIIFGDEDSIASYDILQRIQDFRKKGIGLFLITHNVSDINIGIRRLCQLKLYFRQSPDIAKSASNDLLFPIEQADQVIDKLKILEQGACAFTPIQCNLASRQPLNSIFVNTVSFVPKSELSIHTFSEETTSITKIIFLNNELIPLPNLRIIISYVGETILEDTSDASGCIITKTLMYGKRAKLTVLGEKKKDTRQFEIFGGKENKIFIQ